MSEIVFKSKWFEKCVRDYLQIGDGPITQEDLNCIKYIEVQTTNGFSLQFGKDSLPKVFEFNDAGDEWWCCISDTGKYNNLDEFITIREWGEVNDLKIKKEILELESKIEEQEEYDEASMAQFMQSVKEYWAEESDFEAVEKHEEAEEDDEIEMVFGEDIAYFAHLEALRLMSCECNIHSLKFLNALPLLRVLEVGEVGLYDLEGIEKLIGLEKLCIWTN